VVKAFDFSLYRLFARLPYRAHIPFIPFIPEKAFHLPIASHLPASHVLGVDKRPKYDFFFMTSFCYNF